MAWNEHSTRCRGWSPSLGLRKNDGFREGLNRSYKPHPALRRCAVAVIARCCDFGAMDNSPARAAGIRRGRPIFAAQTSGHRCRDAVARRESALTLPRSGQRTGVSWCGACVQVSPKQVPVGLAESARGGGGVRHELARPATAPIFSACAAPSTAFDRAPEVGWRRSSKRRGRGILRRLSRLPGDPASWRGWFSAGDRLGAGDGLAVRPGAGDTDNEPVSGRVFRRNLWWEFCRHDAGSQAGRRHAWSGHVGERNVRSAIYRLRCCFLGRRRDRRALGPQACGELRGKVRRHRGRRLIPLRAGGGAVRREWHHGSCDRPIRCRPDAGGSDMRGMPDRDVCDLHCAATTGCRVRRTSGSHLHCRGDCPHRLVGPAADRRSVPDAFYAGCFLGMSAPRRLKGWMQPCFAAILLAAILVPVRALLPGIGGSLGLAALVTLAILAVLPPLTVPTIGFRSAMQKNVAATEASANGGTGGGANRRAWKGRAFAVAGSVVALLAIGYFAGPALVGPKKSTLAASARRAAPSAPIPVQPASFETSPTATAGAVSDEPRAMTADLKASGAPADDAPDSRQDLLRGFLQWQSTHPDGMPPAVPLPVRPSRNPAAPLVRLAPTGPGMPPPAQKRLPTRSTLASAPVAAASSVRTNQPGSVRNPGQRSAQGQTVPY